METVFRDLASLSFEGAQGVKLFDSGVAGPSVAITIMTHGNEPCGLDAYNYFSQHSDILKKGKVFFCLNNIKAGEQYFQATSAKEKRRCRFIDENMNRITSENKDSYEFKRVQELKPIYQQFDYALDIHSTALPSDTMLILPEGTPKALYQGIPAKLAIEGIVEKQIGTPAIGFYAGECIGYEAGSHEDEQAGYNATQAMLAFLRNTGVVDHSEEALEMPAHYTVFDSIVFRDSSDSLAKEFKHFSKVTQGDVIASGDQGDIKASEDGFALFPPPSLKPNSIHEEVMFLAKLTV
ncbi:MAG: succinylglutamate desuccinylase/aspartoacylase family protein [Pseudomonadota bacterium]|nr:succinylglutamate desuccinylase/aspartoacylase family protein [Pseudomonadota bacterium]